MTLRFSQSVIVCTFRRQHYLDELFERLMAQAPAPIEIVLVDAEASVVTEALAARFSKLCGPRVRYVAEPMPGLSHARNRGLGEARGDWLTFLDDDALPEPGWSAALERGAERGPRVGILGGPVDLALEAVEPDWLSQEAAPFHHWLGRLDLGAQDIACGSTGGACSPGLAASNVTFRRSAVGNETFDTSLGRHMAALLVAEQAAFIRRIQNRCWESWYVAGARTTHRVPRECLVPRWFVDRGFWEGRAHMRVIQNAADIPPAPTGSDRSRTLAGSLQRLLGAGLKFSQLPLKARIDLAHMMGEAMEFHVNTDNEYIENAKAIALHVLDGDAPGEFIGWLNRQPGNPALRSVGAA